MMTVTYNEAVEAMEQGLLHYLPREAAHHMAEIFTENSMDGVHSHGMNRFPRCLEDMESGLCDRTVLQAEKVSGYGGFERWDGHCGVGPLIAEQCTRRAMELAREHGIGLVACANNSHWLRAGRYGLMMADNGFAGICFTNTCLNLTCYGAKEASTGNNPIVLALPHPDGSLLMDMAVSQYAYGKLEIMAQKGETLPMPCGYDTEGHETCDPAEICRSGLMLPIALWKGSALSIMLDLAAATLSGGRTSLDIGKPADGERGMSQVFIAMHPAALGDTADTEERIRRTTDYLQSLKTAAPGAVRIPGRNIPALREKHLREGIPVTEQTWQKILSARG